MFNYVSTHFETFLKELELSPEERQDAEGKTKRIARSLFAAYYPNQEFTNNYHAIVGSYGKGCAGRPRTDIDMIFLMPNAEYTRINSIMGNKQSYLLQDVKGVLLDTFSSTDIKGDGPVVKVPFQTYNVEVVPVFRYNDTLFMTPHTKNGGNWGYTAPAVEMQWLKNVDAASLGKATHLTKMLKVWKRECNVEMKSICLEVAASVFINQWSYRDKTTVYYDFMVRDFFKFLLQYNSAGSWAKPAGINEQIPLGDSWQSKCFSAYGRALKACEYEHADNEWAAATEWQKIFGAQFKAESPLAKYFRLQLTGTK